MSSTAPSSFSPDRPAPPPPPVTFEEFLAWCDEDTRAEWVDGEIVPMSPDNINHHRLMLFLYELLSHFVGARQLGEVLVAGILMRLPTRPSGRGPDLLFLAADHAERLKETYLDGPADLVVEIISPDSVERDRVDKLSEYEAGGVPEYWLIDPIWHEALFYQRDADGRYHPAQLDNDGFYHSRVLKGFRLQVAWLWQRPLPSVAEVGQQIEAR